MHSTFIVFLVGWKQDRCARSTTVNGSSRNMVTDVLLSIMNCSFRALSYVMVVSVCWLFCKNMGNIKCGMIITRYFWDLYVKFTLYIYLILKFIVILNYHINLPCYDHFVMLFCVFGMHTQVFSIKTNSYKLLLLIFKTVWRNSNELLLFLKDYSCI